MTSVARDEIATNARAALVRRGRGLSRLTILCNVLEGIASITAGVLAGSVSLIGFGIDSAIEVASSLAALWRLRADAEPARRERVEAITLRLIGISLLALAAYIVIDAGHSLYAHAPPERSWFGVIVAAASAVTMPLLARAKRRIGEQLDSRALRADAMQTSLCTYLSAIVLAGVALNMLFGWWWADPVAAICMTPIIAKEGLEGLRAEDHCADCV